MKKSCLRNDILIVALVHSFIFSSSALPDIFLKSASEVIGQGAVWDGVNLENLIGGMLLKETKADVAIFDSLPDFSPQAGPLAKKKFKELTEHIGRILTIRTTGRQIKNIATAIRGARFRIYGTDLNVRKIAGRPIKDGEYFKIALSESVLLRLFDFTEKGGLAESFDVRPPFVESFYGKPENLLSMRGISSIQITDTKNEITIAIENLSESKKFSDIFHDFLQSYDANEIIDFLRYPDGKPHSVLTLNIEYLDIGISKNVANDTYEDYKDGKMASSRASVPLFAHLFLYSKISLVHEAPGLISTLFTDVKYFHVNLDNKPEKDKVKIGLHFRLPWERSLFEGRPVVIAPIFKNEFETKLVPNFWSKPIGISERAKKIDTLLGANINFRNLGFNIDVGALMLTDFNRVDIKSAIDLGPVINFYSRWPLVGSLELSSEVTSFYLFSLPHSKNINKKMALGIEGTIWLRLLRFHDFSFSAMSDFMIASLQSAPSRIALSSIFGFTISYGHIFRIFG